MSDRRWFLGQLSAVLAVGPVMAVAESTGPLVQVYKSATCGCCKQWVKHLRNAGFTVEATDVADVSVYKREYGVPPQLTSCHTAIVAGYVVEGHVPADDVIKMLRQKPDITGIAVPGMPMGSPGMEGPNATAFDVIAFNGEGDVYVYATHTP